MIVLVVGMHRSGTSLAARGLHAMGANLGTPVDTHPHPANPHGHWEHARVWPAQERLLIRFGREWHSSPGPLPDRWLEWPDTAATIAEFAAIAAAEVGRHGQWVVKDPRSSLLIPLWKAVARRAGTSLRAIQLVRPAADVAASLAVRNQMPRDLALRIWADHEASIRRDTADIPTLTIQHAELLGDPQTAFASMAEFCGLPSPRQRAAAAAALVEDGLWHHRAGEAEPGPLPVVSLSAAPSVTPGDQGRVLVVMRTRWRLHMLPRGLRSLLAQTYPWWFLQIVNDGGPPHAVEAEVAAYRHLLGDRLGILHFDRQQGMEAATNAALRERPSAWLAIHDDDDTWRPEFLERMVGRLQATGGGAAVCQSLLVTEAWDGSDYVSRQVSAWGPLPHALTAAYLADSNRFPPISLLVRRSLADTVGPFHEGLPALGDWHFNRRLAAHGPIDLVPETLACWHRRDPTDRVANSPRIDHWRMEEFVRAWPEPAPLPAFFSELRQVTMRGAGPSLAGLPRHAVPDATTGDPTAALPPGLYLIRFPLAAPADAGECGSFHVRTTPVFTRGQSVPLFATATGEAAVLVNAAEPVLGMGMRLGAGGIDAVPAPAEALRLGDPLGFLSGFAGPPRVPDVLCIGAQRAGTTWLHAALTTHPAVWDCGIKEFHHFDDDDGGATAIGAFRQEQGLAVVRAHATGTGAERDAFVRIGLAQAFPAGRSWEHYAQLFAAAPSDRTVCDFTPAYATLPESDVADIARMMPQTKVIFLLRDPVVRAVSGAWHRLRRDGVERPTEAELLEACLASDNVIRTDYVRTLDIWQRHVAADRLLVLFHDDIAADPVGLLQRTCAFLGLDPLPDALAAARAAARVARHADPPGLSAAELARVKARLSADWLPMLIELERRLGGPVPQWRRAAEMRVRGAQAAAGGARAGHANTVAANLAQWNHLDPWAGAGDQWDGQARACGVAYEDWKAGIVARYLPLIPAHARLLEIGPGHGRWSDLFIDHVDELVLSDISPNCLDACRHRLAGRGRLRTHVSLAADLPEDLTAAVDAVWSYDCLVHVGPEECARMIAEIARVLRPGGVAVLHHADQPRGVVPRLRAMLRHLMRNRPAGGGASADHGWRSAVSRGDVERWATAAGLVVERVDTTWTWNSPHGRLRVGVPRFGDCITIIRRPREA
jgi:SAM-dependent methyltransferase